jgi:hypothetical protein
MDKRKILADKKREQDQVNDFNYLFKHIAKEPEKQKCKHFGCGKTLLPMESLFGDYCFKHARIINQKHL